MEMEKTYQPQLFEKKLYAKWQEGGFFKAQVEKDKKPFTIVMPPPNITAQLHIGHALNNTLQDAIIRFKRMQGFNALWIPGTDHASIATEVKIVESLAKEGLSKQEIGREEFLRRAYLWKDKYGGRIVEQIKQLGCSCDWDRLSFTMDERCSKAVRHYFVKLYNKKLIYRGNRITNWCPCCKTALSDAEVIYQEESGSLWYFFYKTEDGKDKITFATTRPETMLGDTAVAVNPSDARYAHLLGKKVLVPFVNRLIPVIADDYVEKDFGSGVVKITPAHDPNDFEVGLRHNLPQIKVIAENGKMSEAAQQFEGLDRYDCRKKIIAEMKKLGQWEKTEAYKHNVGNCYRCDTVIEPMLSKQWYIDMKPLAKPALEAVKKGDTKFIPKRFEKTYFSWLDNIRDWCISRQLWWGHRIPVWYCGCGEEICSEDIPKACPKCGGALRQDEDVLDTWFSSALWPFSTLGYPESNEDLKYFYPTNVLVTMYDIIFFWVARMVFSGIECMGETPFPQVLIHGAVRDGIGRKMSKSLGNGIDPVEFIEQYGADTLRFSLLNGVASGNDMRFKSEKVGNTRNFMNKIWNASRFALLNCEGKELLPLEKCQLSLADNWILTRLNAVIKDVTKNMEKYELGRACALLYDFVWSEFCDWYIELSKPLLYGSNEGARLSTLSVLVHVLDKILKLLHPIIPFITEEIYQYLPMHGETIMKEAYPLPSRKNYKKESALIELVKDAVSAVRNVRAQRGVKPSKRIRLFISLSQGIEENGNITMYIEKLANAQVSYAGEDIGEKAVKLVCALGEITLPLGDLVDAEEELKRIDAQLEKIQKEIELAQSKLSNERFMQKAPPALVKNEKEKLESYQTLKSKLLSSKEDFLN